jgi:hypothetical protein
MMVSQETVHDNRPVDNFLFKAMLMEQLSGEKYDQDESPYFRQASLSQEKLPVIEPNQELKNEMKSTGMMDVLLDAEPGIHAGWKAASEKIEVCSEETQASGVKSFLVSRST